MTCGRSGQNRFSNLSRFQSHPVFGHYGIKKPRAAQRRLEFQLEAELDIARSSRLRLDQTEITGVRC